MPPLIGEDHPRAFGRKMRDLRPLQRQFVIAYCKTGNASEAYRQSGYKGRSAKAASVNASELMSRSDIADAIVEEMERRLRASLPTSVKVAERLRDGIGAKGAKVPASVQAKMATWLAESGGVGPTQKVQVEHSGEIGLNVQGEWEGLARMVAGSGGDPDHLLRNLSAEMRGQVLLALGQSPSVSEVE